MKPATREWVKKAENDFETALALMRPSSVRAPLPLGVLTIIAIEPFAR